MRTPLDFAMRYATRGWPVFPIYEATGPRVCSCKLGESCGRDAGKHPRTPHGFTDASLDVDTIGSWWARWPTANVGIATGTASGLVVLDVDPRHGGGASLARLQLDHGVLPRTATVRTGGGGAHLYYQHTPRRIVRSRTNVGDYHGLDLKADGGYVVAPPSLHASGEPYRWYVRERLAEAPEWLLCLAEQEPLRAVPALRPRSGPPLADLEDALRRCPRVRARFERNADGLRDTSPSGVDLGLASGLALVGFDSDTIASAILESRARAGLPAKRTSYLRSTVSKALGAAQGAQS